MKVKFEYSYPELVKAVLEYHQNKVNFSEKDYYTVIGRISEEDGAVVYVSEKPKKVKENTLSKLIKKAGKCLWIKISSALTVENHSKSNTIPS